MEHERGHGKELGRRLVRGQGVIMWGGNSCEDKL